MPRVFFRVCKIHSCFDQCLNEPKPKRCTCRKLISMREAGELVENGTADWLLEYSKKGVRQTWDVVLRGRANKTPRAHTLESYNPARAPHSFGQIERIIDYSMSDGGRCMNWIERHLDGVEEDETHLFEEYRRLELEMQYELFGSCGQELKWLKEVSDGLGTVTGERARIIEQEINKRANAIKQRDLKEDLLKGCPILSYIGMDGRTAKRK